MAVLYIRVAGDAIEHSVMPVQTNGLRQLDIFVHLLQGLGTILRNLLRVRSCTVYINTQTVECEIDYRVF